MCLHKKEKYGGYGEREREREKNLLTLYNSLRKNWEKDE
jgi:hypothetical protein